MQSILALLGLVVSLVYGAVSIWAAYLGLDQALGWWAILIVIGCLFFRFTLPLVVGAFLGALNVWHWHWALALLFAAPGLVFIIPSVVAALLSALPSRRAS